MPRKGPTESATKFKVGTKKRGNDGGMWEIIVTSNGVQRWKKISQNNNSSPGKTSTKRSPRKGKDVSRQRKIVGNNPIQRERIAVGNSSPSYLTHDNGGRPFLVKIINKNTVEIYKQPEMDYEEEEKMYGKKNTYTKLVKKYNDIEIIFVGKSPLNKTTKFSEGYGPKFTGNSILLKLKTPTNRYVFIGESVYEFTAPEEITKYYSSVGNSDVPYPVALSKNYAYFMIGPSMHHKEKKKIGGEYVPKTSFPKGIDWSDAYTQYYDIFPENWYKDRKGKAFPFKNVKLIHKRNW